MRHSSGERYCPLVLVGADIKTSTADEDDRDRLKNLTFIDFSRSIRIGYGRRPHVTISVGAGRAVGSLRNRK